MNAKIMIALVAFTAVFAGCLVMADVSDAEGSDSAAATATVIYQDDTGKDILIVPFETDANGKVYTVLTWADMGTAAPEGKEFTKWMEVSVVKDPETTETTKEANTNYLLKTGDTLTLRADFSFETYTVTVMDGETIVGTYTASVTEVGEKIKYPALGTFAYGETEEEMTYLKDFEMEDTDSKQFKGLDITLDTEITADTIVNVVWTPIYKVTWMVGDYTVATGSTKLDAEDKMASLAQPDDPVKANFDFKGWKDAAGVLLTADYKFETDTIFTAQFTPSSLSVSFMDGEKVVLKVTVLYGDCISADKIPVGYDWDFDFSKPIVENTVIGLKAVEPVPEPEPASEPDNTTTYVLVALFGVLVIAGLVLGIRQLKK